MATHSSVLAWRIPGTVIFMTKSFYLFHSAVVDFQVALVVKDFLVAQRVKNLLAMQETRIRSLGQEDPLGKGMAIHSSVLAWRIPGTGEPGGLPSVGSHRVGHD